MSYVKPLSTIYRFPDNTYNTQAAYLAATGKTAPVYDPNRPIKRWVDPTITTATNPRRQLTYSFVTVEEGKPVIVQLSMFPSQAMAVNIPPDSTGELEGMVFGEGMIPDPIVNPIPAHLEIRFMPIAGLVVVDLTEERAVLDTTPGFTVDDRRLLQQVHAALVATGRIK